MRVVGAFDPLNPPDNTGKIYVGSNQPCAKLKMYNNSSCNIQLNFPGTGHSNLLHAKEANVFQLPVPTKYIEYSIFSQLAVDPTEIPISEVSMILYDKAEDIGGTYPISIAHQTNIGNLTGVKTTTSGSNMLQNDGNPANAPILETTVQGQTSSNQTATNDGIWSLSALIAGALHQFFKTQPTGSLLLLGNSGDTTEVLGVLKVDNGVNITGASTFNNAVQINSTLGVTGNATFGTMSVGAGFQMTGGDITMNGHNFVDPVHFTSTISVGGGYSQNGGDINMNSHGVLGGSYDSLTWKATGDTISQTHEFNGSGAGTYNHGGHATPWMVSPVCNLNNSTSTVGADSFTSTQCHIDQPSAMAFRAGVFVG